MRLKRYLDNLLAESINDRAIFKAVFVAGTPGAGKSYTIRKLTSGQISPRIVNTDIYTEYFGKGANLSAQEWELYGTKIEHLSFEKLYQYINSVLPLWIDSTSANPSNTIRRKGILESFGYDTAAVFINTFLETSIKRNANRTRKVPEDFIRDVYNKIQRIKPFYKNNFKHFWEINNDDGELTDSAIIKASLLGCILYVFLQDEKDSRCIAIPYLHLSYWAQYLFPSSVYWLLPV